MHHGIRTTAVMAVLLAAGTLAAEESGAAPDEASAADVAPVLTPVVRGNQTLPAANAHGSLPVVAGPGGARLYTVSGGQPVIAEPFDADLSNWVSEGPNSAEVKEGKLVIRTREKTPDGKVESGQYLWFRKDLPADFRVEFDFTPKSPSGFFLLFFCAKGVAGEDILGDKLMKEYKALPDFKKYTTGPINCYHISYRRNTNADCNLRKNTGKHLLSNSPVDQVIPADKTAHVVLTKQGGHITLTVDGVSFMDFTDDGKINGGVYGAGKFGFRQVYESEGEYDNVRVFDLGK
jgi:hypothetical protein